MLASPGRAPPARSGVFQRLGKDSGLSSRAGMSKAEAPLIPKLLRPRSIGWHIGALSLGLVLPAIIVIALLLNEFSASERRRIEATAQTLARALARAVDSDIENITTTLQALAASPSIESGDLAVFHRQAMAVRQLQGLHFSFRDERSVTRVTTRLPFGQPFGPNPEPVVEADVFAMRERKPTVSNLFRGPITGSHAIQIVVPVLSEDPTRHVVGASLEPDFFVRILNRLDRGPGWTLSIVDDNDIFVARVPRESDFIGRSTTPTFQANTKADRGLYYGPNRDGSQSLIAFDTSAATGWKVSVTLPLAQVDAPFRRSLALFGASGIVLGGLGFGLAWLMRRRLLRSIDALVALARAVGGGSSAAPGGAPLSVTDMARVGATLIEASDKLQAATAEVRQSEARVRRVLDNLFAFVGLLELDGTLVEVNQAPLAVAGLERSDVVGKPFWECHWWTYSAEAALRIRRSCEDAAAGQTERFDIEVLAAHGRLITIDYQIVPLMDGDGRIVGVQPSGVDISDRTRAQRELAERERRSRLVADLRERLDQEVEPEDVLRVAASELRERLGLDHVSFHEIEAGANRVVRHGLTDPEQPRIVLLDVAYAPETRVRLAMDEIVDIFDVRLDPTTASRAETFERRGMRSCMAVPVMRRGQWMGSLVFGSAEPRHWCDLADFARTLSERVWIVAENARLLRDLTVSEERLQIGVAISGLGLAAVDYLEDTITFDASAARTLGLPADVALPRAELHGRFHPEDAPSLLEGIQRLVAEDGGGFMAVEHRIVRPDGEVAWLLAQNQVIYGAGPGGARRAVKGILAVLDVTPLKRVEEARRKSEERLRSFASSNVIGMVYGDLPGAITYANDEFLRIIGRSGEAVEGGALRWDSITPPEWRAADERGIAEARQRGACTPYEKECLRPDGSRVPVLVGYTLSDPDRGEAVAFIIDMTERKRIERSLEEGADRLSLSQEAAQAASWEWDVEKGGFQAFPGESHDLYELPADWNGGFEDWLLRVHPEDRSGLKEGLTRAAAESGAFEAEFRIKRRGGGWKWMYGRGVGAGDRPRLAGINMDISLRKELEENQKFLIRELHHRIKNTLATVQAIAGTTMRTAGSMEEFRSSFGQRLNSLARSHTLLTENAWAGADLEELIRLEVLPYDERGRVRLAGPPVALPAELAVPLGLGLHELATNAAKHGALSALTGCLSVTWRIEAGEGGKRLSIEWVERGGPAARPPSRQGFGSRLLDRVLGPQINGSTQIRFEPEGLVAVIEAPLVEANLPGKLPDHDL
jgi:PAS domain S-box-containing protein